MTKEIKCSRCKQPTGNKRYRCNPCERKLRKVYVEKNREKINLKQRQHKYKITFEEVVELINRGKCDICSKSCRVVIDHCHKTGKVRGALCTGCNGFLGWLENRLPSLQAYLDYLRKNQP